MDPQIKEALGYMSRSTAVCPDAVKARIAALRVPVEEVPGTRSLQSNWRSSGGGHSGGYSGGGRGFSRGGYRGGGTGGGGGGGYRGPPPSSSPAPAPSPSQRGRYANRAAMPRFGSKAVKDVSTEVRMMDRIREKMNKFSTLTYDATKAWLSQMLDDGETEFLTAFITLVFEKAASEPSFCALYARLITELVAGFPPLKTDLLRIFGAFIGVFEYAEEPAVDSEEYAKFVAMRERRRFRRGYATFIGEIARHGVLSVADVLTTCTVILDGLEATKKRDGQGVLCEEYADCLTNLVKACSKELAPVAASLLVRVRSGMERTGCLTNKARFALMDVAELLKA